MKAKKDKLFIKISDILKGIILFIVGGISVHFIVMTTNFYTFYRYNINSPDNVLHSLFSYRMIPMMIVYGLFFLIIFTLLRRLRAKIIENHKNELAYKCQNIMLTTMQRVTAITVDSIASNNKEILEWIEMRKRNGNASVKVEHASRNIAHILKHLSELTYVVPYTKETYKSIDEFEESMKNRLAR